MSRRFAAGTRFTGIPMKSRIFKAGFLSGRLTLFIINIFSYYSMVSGSVMNDANIEFGFPFKLYASGGFSGNSIVWHGLIADLLVAICAGVIFGLLAVKLLKIFEK